jgi:hypothetical protein
MFGHVEELFLYREIRPHGVFFEQPRLPDLDAAQ